ncbi:MAG: UDP-N-acetylmuramate dehydrogenase, partial [Candidatus Aureabacteria bacterium]|nr:UDP-N-acetylmuramate dehydrogenase [Candidatus Auribacterota bacterium]
KQFLNDLYFDEPLCNHTSFKVGGPADIFFKPDSVEQLASFLQVINDEKLKYFVIGNGTNLLFADNGFRGAVIQLSKPVFRTLEIESDSATCGSGVNMTELAYKTAEIGLSGCEYMAGLPGTIGGAVITNAGAFGQDAGNIVEKIESIDGTGKKSIFGKADMVFSYRKCSLSQVNVIVTRVFLRLFREKRESVEKRVKEFLSSRDKSCVNAANAGSVFKNPGSVSAWKLIDGAGLRNVRLGGARVSDKHANVIINEGNATSRDIRNLIEIVQVKVFEQFGIGLETEIKIIPEILDAQ